jgi:hypothetical protein
MRTKPPSSGQQQQSTRAHLKDTGWLVRAAQAIALIVFLFLSGWYLRKSTPQRADTQHTQLNEVHPPERRSPSKETSSGSLGSSGASPQSRVADPADFSTVGRTEPPPDSSIPLSRANHGDATPRGSRTRREQRSSVEPRRTPQWSEPPPSYYPPPPNEFNQGREEEQLRAERAERAERAVATLIPSLERNARLAAGLHMNGQYSEEYAALDANLSALEPYRGHVPSADALAARYLALMQRAQRACRLEVETPNNPDPPRSCPR